MSDQTPNPETQLAAAPVAPGFAKASQSLSLALGLTPAMMVNTLKAQCFKCRPDDVTDEQMAALVVIANELGVNPLLPGMLYAYPNPQGGGITPMMGPDAVYKKLFEHVDIDTWETIVYPEDPTLPPTHATCKIWRKNRGDRPLTKTCLLSEWQISSNPNWKTRPRHMLELRTTKQGARMVIHGIPFDEDERKIMAELNVTPGAEDAPDGNPPPVRKDPPARRSKEPKGVNAVPDAAPVKDKPAASNIVEGEFTETPRDAAPPADQKAVDQEKAKAAETEKAQAEKAAKEKAEKEKSDAAKSAAAKLAEKAAPTQADTAAETPKPRAFLKADEEITCVCTVKSVSPLIANIRNVPTPSAQIELTGGFNGPVVHFGGGTQEGDAVIPLPIWKVGSSVSVTLFGRLNKTSGRVLASVLSVTEASPATAAMEVE